MAKEEWEENLLTKWVAEPKPLLQLPRPHGVTTRSSNRCVGTLSTKTGRKHCMPPSVICLWLHNLFVSSYRHATPLFCNSRTFAPNNYVQTSGYMSMSAMVQDMQYLCWAPGGHSLPTAVLIPLTLFNLPHTCLLTFGQVRCLWSVCAFLHFIFLSILLQAIMSCSCYPV